MKRHLPDAKLLPKLLRYDAATGRLTWLPRTPDLFEADRGHSPEHLCSKWNSRYAGREAFTYQRRDGYFYGQIFGIILAAHRVIWALQTGSWPEHDIDHINGVTSENRFVNLREASRSDNMRNRRLERRNKSGATGVYRYRDGERWYASIRVAGRSKYLGIFGTFEAARAARAQAQRQHGYHPNHGRAA